MARTDILSHKRLKVLQTTNSPRKAKASVHSHVKKKYDRALSPSSLRTISRAYNPHSNPFLRQFDLNEATFHDHCTSENENDHSDSDQDSLFEYGDEDTLVAALRPKDCDIPDPTANAKDLANSLGKAFETDCIHLTEHLGRVLVPAVNRAKEIHRVLDVFDTTLADGLMEFNDACKSMEAMSVKEEEKLRAVYKETQLEVEDLFAQLDVAYKRRETLWTTYATGIEDRVESAINTLNTVPASLERTMTGIEKEFKEAEKENEKGDDLQPNKKMLQNLLQTAHMPTA